VQSNIAVDTSTKYQPLWGFGAAAGAPAKKLETWNPGMVHAMLDKLYATDGNNAGLSIFRLVVNPNVRPSPNTWDWNADEPQVWMAKEAAKRSAVAFLGTPWSPPAFMKTTNSTSGGGSLKPAQYGAFATYLYDWASHYKTVHGLNLKWVSVQNEPQANVSYDMCLYTPEQLDAVATLVADKFHQEGSDVLVGAPENSNDEYTTEFLSKMTASLPKLDWIASHDYSWNKHTDLSGFGKPILQTETCGGGETPNDASINDGLRWARRIHLHLGARERGYLFWYALSEKGTLNSLITVDAAQQTYTLNKRLFVFGQFSRFLRPGSTVVKATTTGGTLKTVAATDSNGALSIVITNDEDYPQMATVSGFSSGSVRGRITSEEHDLAEVEALDAQGGTFACVLPPRSIVSLRKTSP
jgi:O-glycosyl hydrolase